MLNQTVRYISACLLASITLSPTTGCGGDLATDSSSGGSTSGIPSASTSGADATSGNPTGADATGADATGQPTGADETGTTGDPPPPPPAMTLNCADEYSQDFGVGHELLARPRHRVPRAHVRGQCERPHTEAFAGCLRLIPLLADNTGPVGSSRPRNRPRSRRLRTPGPTTRRG